VSSEPQWTWWPRQKSCHRDSNLGPPAHSHSFTSIYGVHDDDDDNNIMKPISVAARSKA
jgi:hypothetical protein